VGVLYKQSRIFSGVFGVQAVPPIPGRGKPAAPLMFEKYNHASSYDSTPLIQDALPATGIKE
jgi:hypothetical protein